MVYLSFSGLCKTDVTGLITMAKVDGSEYAMRIHYGDKRYVGSDCSNGNICLFLDSSDNSCTDTNTGKTGVDVVVDVEETTSEEPHNRPLEPVNPYNCVEMSLIRSSHVEVAFIMIIYLLVST